jgi:lipopolysaccharide biosynthesis protein
MNKIPVFLYLYHLDLWPEFLQLLLPIKNKIILNLAMCEDFVCYDVEKSCKYYFENYDITYHPNAGVDVLPFLKQLVKHKNEETAFLKLHSKKSNFFKDLNWRSVLLQSLIGSKKNFNSNINQFKNEKIGVLSNKVFSQYKGENLNGDKINELCNYLGINYQNCKNKKFVAGNMFFGRIDLFKKYFNEKTIKIIEHKLLKERGSIKENNGSTYCHSLERLFGYIAQYENYKIGYCYEKTIKILNSKGPDNKLHLIKQYDNQCYIQENVCVYGRITKNTNKILEIEWRHPAEKIKRKYKKISNNSIVGL